MEIKQLNTNHGIAGQLTFIKGNSGFPFIMVNNGSATALISVYGAQVLSFQPSNEPEDLLFLSQKSHYEEGKAIRGGIPICWPWFGPDPLDLNRPDHGFVRNGLWTVLATEATSKSETKIKLRFQNSKQSENYWQQSFKLDIEISVSDTLTIELITHNTGTEVFSITQVLHAYFSVGNIDDVQILGLENAHYLYKRDDGEEKNQSGALIIADEVDRIYTTINNELIIVDRSFNRQIIITATHNKTTVIWNPWIDICAKMPDLAYDDYQRFICVEPGNVDTDIVEIPPGGEFHLITNFKIVRNQH
jgi:glucose-6-phosphate 1-epimerase